VWLCNARNVKELPGRKTDLTDAERLADVAAHGMVRPSFVPPLPIRELRELTRYRKTQIDARAAEIQRCAVGVPRDRVGGAPAVTAADRQPRREPDRDDGGEAKGERRDARGRRPRRRPGLRDPCQIAALRSFTHPVASFSSSSH
jgi:hypothetical protein